MVFFVEADGQQGLCDFLGGADWWVSSISEVQQAGTATHADRQGKGGGWGSL